MVGKLKKTRVKQIIPLGILPVMGGRGATYRKCKRVAMNALEEQMCEEAGVGFVDLWGYFVGKDISALPVPEIKFEGRESQTI